MTPLEKLRTADPETFEMVCERLSKAGPPDETPGGIGRIVEEVIWALAQETGFGRAYAEGMLQIRSRAPAALDGYCERVHDAARTGETLAQIVARHAAPVMIAGEGLPQRFTETVAVMRGKGTYTLNAPLEALTHLLAAGDRASAAAYLHLLSAVFRQPMNYNQSLRLSYLLPDAVRGFAPRRRRLHIAQAARLAEADLQLIDPFLDGLRNGLAMLGEPELERFVGEAIMRFVRNAAAGRLFLSLESNGGRERCAGLQVAVGLAQVEANLRHYVQARLGRSVVIRGCAQLPAAPRPLPALVCSDGEVLYLADELDHYPGRAENQALYKTLARLEAGLLEIGTYRFDLERAADRYPEVAARFGGTIPAPDVGCGDAERFIHSFACPSLADDLFTILEQGRLMRWMTHTYPGLAARLRPLLAREADPAQTGQQHPLQDLYTQQVLQESRTGGDLLQAAAGGPPDPGEACVEAMAAAVCRVYDAVAGTLAAPYTPLPMPFGWRLQWHLVTVAQADRHQIVERIRAALARHELRLYRSDLRRRLAEQGGTLGAGDIQALLLEPGAPSGPTAIDVRRLDFAALLQASGLEPTAVDPADHAVRYPEWDDRLQDYLLNHVAVFMKTHPATDGGLYDRILEKRRGLLVHTRRAFELLRPERLKRLRPWCEGEEFDYRALLDFAVYRRMGRTPPDRLYIKRIKQERDVAVLLLVDLSRSTANTVAGGGATVMQVTQEALVIFCEALRVAGDQFAIAGFSGSGRHAVEYFTIKAFDEPLDGSVPGRIAALAPRRSTRMGAAVRHAAAGLARIEARVRVLLLISDGFPNDLDYKAEYAVADTRHAVQEARANRIHVKAITVNIGSDPRLDDLYGRRHHHVIGDVPELPGKLLRLYSALTRH